MKLQEASGAIIYWTKEYSAFKFLKGNRDIMQHKINKIKKSVGGGLDLFKYAPIIVDKDYRIIDGQHRFWACKEMKMNIYFMIIDEVTIRDIATLNSNTDKWKAKDFINCYIDLGVRHYRALFDFMEKHKFSVTTSANLLCFGEAIEGGANVSSKIKDGLFEVRHEERANEIAAQTKELIEFTEKPQSRSFIKAVGVLMDSESYSQEVLIKKLQSSGEMIKERGTYKEYLSHIEDLYNFKNRKRTRIY